VHVEDIHHLLLRLTPPPDEPEDSSIGCEVQMPVAWRPRRPSSSGSPGVVCAFREIARQ
jgi:hypothetical protein